MTPLEALAAGAAGGSGNVAGGGSGITAAQDPGASAGSSALPRAVLHVPLMPEPGGGPFAFVVIGLSGRTAKVMLDTGMPFDARLSPPALGALGLPTTRAEWLAAGAVPFDAGGGINDGGQPIAMDLLVKLDRLELPCHEGTVIYEQPWVVLAGLRSDGTPDPLPYDGLLGAGALLPFARIGLRSGEGVLELQPGSRMTLAASGDGAEVDGAEAGRAEAGERRPRWIVPPRGEFIGFTLQVPIEPGAPGIAGLPRIVRVSEGTAAAAAGLRSGDGLLRIGATSCRAQAPASLWPQLWPAAGLALEIEVLHVDGTSQTAVLP